jgi:hypothetical protein
MSTTPQSIARSRAAWLTARSAGGSAKLRRTTVGGRSAVENVGEGEGVEGAGRAGFEATGSVTEDEFDWLGDRGRNAGFNAEGFAKQEGAGIRVGGVGMSGKTAGETRAQHLAEVRRERKEQLRRVDETQDGGGEQRVESEAQAVGVEMRMPEGGLLCWIGEIEELA